MSRNASQPNAPYSHRASVRAMWAIAVLLAVSYAGDEHIVRPNALGQLAPEEPSTDAAPSLETAPAASDDQIQAERASITESTSVADRSSPTVDVVDALPTESAEAAAGQDEVAQPKPTIPDKDELEKILARKATLVLRDSTLADSMMAINDTWKVDVVFDQAQLQTHKVSGSFTNWTLEDVLKAILTPKGLGYKKVANGISILPQAEIGGTNLQQVNETIQLEYLEPEQVEPTLRYLLSPEGKTQSLPSPIKALMVIDQPENISQIKKYIAALEQRARDRLEKDQAAQRQQQAETRAAQQGMTTAPDGTQQPIEVEPTIRTVFRPKYLRAADIQEAITNQIPDGTVSTVDAENALVVMGPKSALEATAQLMRELDVPRRQVRISVMMYDVSVDALEALGFNWRNAGKDNIASNGVPNALFDVHSAPMQTGGSAAASTSTTTSTGSTATTATATGTTSSVPFGGFITSATPNLVGAVANFYYVSRYFDISAVIQALQQTDGARLLADPTVTVYDLEQSEIRIVSEIPVQQLTQTEGGGSIGTTTFREAGITLTVMPEIADENWMRLTVSPEFSALQGFSSSGQPIINRRQETTKVKMMNGETLVLGGLRKREEIERVSGVPGLMNIKYLGNLFRSHRTTVTESELIIFIHAEIVNEGCTMLPREQVAHQVTQETLAQIPHASHAPFIPPCNDPYCPYHNPKPRPPHDGISPPSHWGDTNDAQESPSDPNGKRQYAAPLHGRPGRDATPQGTTTEQLPPVPDQSPESLQNEANTDEQPVPPPVLVDPSARIQRPGLPSSQVAMRRLPSVQLPKSLAEENASKDAQPRVNRAKLPVGTDPKSRIAQTPRKRPTQTPATEAPKEKQSWTESIFR